MSNQEELSNLSSDDRGVSIIRMIVEFAIVIAVALLCAFLLKTYVVQPYEIPSGSMENTIMIGDRVLSEKVSYYFGSPKVGDIVTFMDPNIDGGKTLIKRVIATAGQTVNLKDGAVYVDGKKLDESYTDGKPSYDLQSGITYPYKVPSGDIWVMGDNRTDSADSRYFGPVPVSSITGHAFWRYWPLSSFGALN